MTPTRRSILTHGGLTLAAAATSSAFSAAAAASLQNHAPSTSRLFDWSKPADNLTALVKVMGDLSGAAAWLSAQGRIYALRKGEMPLPILGVEGVRRVRFEKIENGYTMYIRDWAFYRDVETGELLEEFENPITGKTNKIRHILTRLISWDMTPDKGQQMPSFTGEAYLIDRPLILPWFEEGNDVTVPLELLVKYPSGRGGGEWEHLMTKADELHNPDLTSASAMQAWTGYSPWLSWMEMGDIEGKTLWQSTGRKHASAGTLRPELLAAAERVFPGSIENPETYEKVSSNIPQE